ncbi:NUMOD4 domain-containing protein [Achromobacter dolens]|uniref:NUMOD4 domain-containing protein n=1 Tax=Achromobacter dolens TaxID=1287738 RepID=UPI0031DB1818
MNEQWRSSAAYPLYEVSNLGRVRRGGRVLRPQLTKKGYLRVCLYSPEGKRYVTVHSLVLEAFICSRPIGMHGCHNDGNRQNNKLANLRWASAADNCADKRIHGTNQAGERHAAHKLTEADVAEIRRAFAAKSSKHWGASLFSKRLGVHRDTVERAARGKSWNI